jgi:hypothetical protein
MSLSAETRPSNGIAYFVVGGILVVLGLVGVVLYATGAPDLTGDAIPLRALTIIGAAIAMGVGALLVVLGVVKRIAASRRDR